MTTPPTTGNATPTPEPTPKKPRWVRLWLVALVAAVGSLAVFLCWPDGSEIDAISRSNEDGKSRFRVTTYGKTHLPPNLPWRTRLMWKWSEFLEQHATRNPTNYTFKASPLQQCGIDGLLNGCMRATGTRYYIAVEIGGVIEFGHTNPLNGAQWVAQVENAIETNGPFVCYDFARKTNFQDRLLLIREKPGVVKVIPRTKLADYQKAGLVKTSSP